MSHTPEVEHFDTVILGSGQGGKLLAWHLGRSGQRVAVVERQWVGGSCPAVACLPSKNEIWSARVAHVTRHAADFGAVVTGPVTVDMTKVRDRKRDMVEREVTAHLNAYAASGAELIMGSGKFVGPKTIEIELNDGGKRTVSGDQVVVNVGTHAAIPDFPGLRAAEPLTHIGSLELDYVPSHLVVLGGGYIGIEMAQTYRRFGSRVTIVERNERLMMREDDDVSAEMLGILRGEEIDVILNAETVKVEGRSGAGVRVALRTDAGEQVIEGSDLLVAVGRVPNTTGIGLEEAGIKLNERGYIRVNEHLQASTAGVWAIGEAAGSPQFTHVSVDDFRIVRDNMAGGNRSTTDRLIPYTMFTEPPLAHVGLSEREAQQKGIAVRVAKLPMKNVLRTLATDESQGFMKVLVGANDDRILGFTMIGAEAGEVLAAMQTAILSGLPYQKLRDAVISHLTYAEGLGPLLANVPARAAA
ncbi:FAD-dependent oxidoreductase [Paraburkholderia acidicola]|uniref:FAD-dependent oxidoreductase n=1 Tax=Paraburkholderia acidicola TaxID=1912599 RepID=A0ABV1LXJ9_9BURK